jgi:Zn-dependent membrane protease YugP
MIAILAILVLLAAVALPQLWVRHTIRRHGDDRPDLPGTGGELARHLLDRFDLGHVRVEVTDRGDHYDPAAAP